MLSSTYAVTAILMCFAVILCTEEKLVSIAVCSMVCKPRSPQDLSSSFCFLKLNCHNWNCDARKNYARAG